MGLPYDIARCKGTQHPLCQACRRREPGHPERQPYMAPPIEHGYCVHRIAPPLPRGVA